MSFYTSLSGLKNAQTDLGVIAHNIANAETNGFKKSTTNFADVVAGTSMSDPRLSRGIGSSVESVTQNFGIGPIEQTGASLDVAITGDGFFTTRGAADGDVLYTRNGSFTMDETGYIHDGSDNRLQVLAADANGNPTSTTPTDARIPPVNAAGAEFAGVTISGKGVVSASYSDGSVAVIGTVALATFNSPGGLRQVGSSNWEVTGISGAARYGAAGSNGFGSLQSGSVERSNVDIAEELVSLITAQRYFQANAKAIDTATQISQTIINLRT